MDPPIPVRRHGFALATDGRDEDVPHVLHRFYFRGRLRIDLFSFFLAERKIDRVDVWTIVWPKHGLADGIRNLFGDTHSVLHGIYMVLRFYH